MDEQITKLKQLKGLLDDGIITQADFDRKKEDILHNTSSSSSDSDHSSSSSSESDSSDNDERHDGETEEQRKTRKKRKKRRRRRLKELAQEKEDKEEEEQAKKLPLKERCVRDMEMLKKFHAAESQRVLGEDQEWRENNPAAKRKRHEQAKEKKMTLRRDKTLKVLQQPDDPASLTRRAQVQAKVDSEEQSILEDLRHKAAEYKAAHHQGGTEDKAQHDAMRRQNRRKVERRRRKRRRKKKKMGKDKREEEEAKTAKSALKVREQQRSLMLDVFKDSDTQNSGAVALASLIKAVETRCGDFLTKEDIKLCLAQCDMDGDGDVSYDEYEMAIDMFFILKKWDKKRMRQVFLACADDGIVQTSELQDILFSSLPGISETDIYDLIDVLDENCDGEVTMAEYEEGVYLLARRGMVKQTFHVDRLVSAFEAFDLLDKRMLSEADIREVFNVVYTGKGGAKKLSPGLVDTAVNEMKRMRHNHDDPRIKLTTFRWALQTINSAHNDNEGRKEFKAKHCAAAKLQGMYKIVKQFRRNKEQRWRRAWRLREMTRDVDVSLGDKKVEEAAGDGKKTWEAASEKSVLVAKQRADSDDDDEEDDETDTDDGEHAEAHRERRHKRKRKATDKIVNMRLAKLSVSAMAVQTWIRGHQHRRKARKMRTGWRRLRIGRKLRRRKGQSLTQARKSLEHLPEHRLRKPPPAWFFADHHHEAKPAPWFFGAPMATTQLPPRLPPPRHARQIGSEDAKWWESDPTFSPNKLEQGGKKVLGEEGGAPEKHGRPRGPPKIATGLGAGGDNPWLNDPTFSPKKKNRGAKMAPDAVAVAGAEGEGGSPGDAAAPAVATDYAAAASAAAAAAAHAHGPRRRRVNKRKSSVHKVRTAMHLLHRMHRDAEAFKMRELAHKHKREKRHPRHHGMGGHAHHKTHHGAAHDRLLEEAEHENFEAEASSLMDQMLKEDSEMKSSQDSHHRHHHDQHHQGPRAETGVGPLHHKTHHGAAHDRLLEEAEHENFEAEASSLIDQMLKEESEMKTAQQSHHQNRGHHHRQQQSKAGGVSLPRIH